MKLLWLDLETTGLDPKADDILAIGLVLTDEHLRDLTYHFTAAIHAPMARMKTMDEVVLRMHQRSGVMAAAALSANSLEDVVRKAHEWAQDAGLKPGEATLAGSSVHFDRAFLYEKAPSLLKYASHRHLDVSALRVLAEAHFPDEAREVRRGLGEPVHIPLADIDGSMRALVAWGRLLFTDSALARMAG